MDVYMYIYYIHSSRERTKLCKGYRDNLGDISLSRRGDLASARTQRSADTG